MASSGERRQRGSGSVFRRGDGMWIGRIELPPGPDGQRRRRQVARTRRTAVDVELRRLRHELADHGDLPDSSPTLAVWANRWLTEVAQPRLKPRSFASYRDQLDSHIVPRLGRKRLDKLQPQDLRGLYLSLADRPTTAHHCHVTLHVLLGDAVREGLVSANVADRVDPPRLPRPTRRALTLDETMRVFRHLAGLPTGMALGFTMALLLGVRQGERLGAIWSEFDLDVGLWDVAWELQRIQYAHGCVDEDGYVTCTAARPSGCPSRVEPVVPVDQPVRRLDGGYWLLGVKSERSQRVIPLPSQVVGLVAAWKAQVFRGDCDGLVFTRPDGQPINAAADSRAWAELLRAANVPHVPLHSARHTTATLLSELDVDEQTLMAILGHAGVSVTRRYTHVSVARRLDALSRLGDQLDLPGSSA